MFNTKLVGTCISAGEESETAPQKAELCENAVAGGEDYADELKLQPSSIGSAATAMTLVGSASALSTNTQTELDTLIRRLNDGAVAYSIIRGDRAPAQVSWSVELGEGERLEALDPRHVERIDAAGHAILTAVAELARDAIGQTVPTKLEGTS